MLKTQQNLSQNYRNLVKFYQKKNEIHSHLPYYHQYKDFKLLYSMGKDGTNFMTLIDKGSNYENTFLLAKSD